MAHPKDRSRLSRKEFIAVAGGAAAGIGVLAGLAACQNTTTPIGVVPEAGGGEGGEGAETPAGSPLVEPKPTGPGGLPLPRPDNAVTWAITDDNPPIAEGLPDEDGPLQVYNYPDYIYPALVKRFQRETGREVQIATYNSADEAVAKINGGAVDFDLIMGLSASHIVSLIAKQALQPLNHAYLTNFEKNIWPELRDPFYDRGSRYTVPYVVWSTGIGWRNDEIDTDIAAMDVPWDIFWESAPYRGKVGILDDSAEALSMPIQRDAMREGRRGDVNSEDPEIVAKAGDDLAELSEIANVKVTITDYQTLPEGKTWLHQAWSGDLLAAAFYYLPEGVPATVLSYWAPEQDGIVQNDFFAIGRNAKSPALAHRFIDFFLDEQIAYRNFVEWNGYVPPQNGIDADTLIQQDLIPETLTAAVVRPEQFAFNQQLLQRTVEGQQLWDQAWSRFKGG